MKNKMIEKNKLFLNLPNPDGSVSKIETDQSIVIIGANGSGKTRLGSWIDMASPQCANVHRLSAQKSLSMPDSITPTSIDRAERDLLCGYSDAPLGQENYYKKGHRWQDKPAIYSLNDYQKLMVYLFSAETEENSKFKQIQRLSELRVEPPKTKLDIVKEVWEKILPHRELIVGGLRIQTKVKNGYDQIYNSSEMSDGERVMFYLIGQCLAAPKDAIVVIDEPEIHLHKSVQVPLWSEIEKLRADCLFVYLTHDVDFAASKENSEFVWLRSFDGSAWWWQKIEENFNLPPSLLLEVLGSRKPVVFVEGENGKNDVAFYRALLDSFLVVPMGSCSHVIQVVKAMRNKESKQFHHLEVYGIIDLDRRLEAEINSLEKDYIFVLKVAEVENLFCTKELLRIISEKLDRNPDDDFKEISNEIFSKLTGEIENQISMRVANEIKFQLNCFDEKAKGVESLEAALVNLTKKIDIPKIYKETEEKFEAVLENRDYEKLLSLYNRKSLASQIGSIFGFSKEELPKMITRIAKNDKEKLVLNATKKYFGNFSSFMK